MEPNVVPPCITRHLSNALHLGEQEEGGDDVRIVEPDVVPPCITRHLSNALHLGEQEEGGDDVRIVEPDVVPSCTTRHLIKQCLTLRGARRRKGGGKGSGVKAAKNDR